MASISSSVLPGMSLRAAPTAQKTIRFSSFGYRANRPMQAQKSLSIGRRTRRSARSARCSVAGEIFTIAATMNVLTLIGVAIGFVLLRVETIVEESE